jgi:hypothetical protein
VASSTDFSTPRRSQLPPFGIFSENLLQNEVR